MTDTPGPVDLLVVGGGMAGLTAAASAATQGARVILVEQGEQVGGSAIYAGFAWTAPSPDVMAEVNPHGDPDLADVLLGGFDRGVDWIRSPCVDCRPTGSVWWRTDDGRGESPRRPVPAAGRLAVADRGPVDAASHGR